MRVVLSRKLFPPGGAVAQLGARLDGIEEVVGSNPIGSTSFSDLKSFDSRRSLRILLARSRPHINSNPIGSRSTRCLAMFTLCEIKERAGIMWERPCVDGHRLSDPYLACFPGE